MIVICGAGITGLSIAREVVKYGVKNITVIEKEVSLGKQASGRSSLRKKKVKSPCSMNFTEGRKQMELKLSL